MSLPELASGLRASAPYGVCTCEYGPVGRDGQLFASPASRLCGLARRRTRVRWLSRSAQDCMRCMLPTNPHSHARPIVMLEPLGSRVLCESMLYFRTVCCVCVCARVCARLQRVFFYGYLGQAGYQRHNGPQFPHAFHTHTHAPLPLSSVVYSVDDGPLAKPTLSAGAILLEQA